MRNPNQLPSSIAGNLGLNPLLMAKTGQLSLMPTIALELPEPQPPVAGPAETESPTEQSA